MFHRFNGSQVRTQCNLCLKRINLQRNKRQAQLKTLRKEVADLLRTSKQENARIRVENIIREQLTLQAFETLELFVQQLQTRTQQIEASKDVPADMLEALSSLVYAAHRLGTDIPELVTIRGHIGHKYGKEFVQESASDMTCRKWHVNENLIKCLAVDPPQPEDKLSMLSEVAQEFGVEWDAKRAADEMLAPGSFAMPQYGMAGGAGSTVPGAWNIDTNNQVPPTAFNAPAQQNNLPDLMSLHVDPVPLPPPAIANTESSSAGSVGWGVPASLYADAAAAAEAARKFSEEARAAADAAQRFATGSGGAGGFGGGGGGGGGVKASSLNPQDTANSSSYVLPPIAHDSAASQSDISAGGGSSSFPPIVHDTAATTTITVVGPGADLGAPASAPPPAFDKRSDSEILRAYNAAPGPPSKGDVKPSAPPEVSSPPPSESPSPFPAGAQGLAPSKGSGDFGLPEPPTNRTPVAPPLAPNPGPAPGPTPPVNELDELTKRFEALKRGEKL